MYMSAVLMPIFGILKFKTSTRDVIGVSTDTIGKFLMSEWSSSTGRRTIISPAYIKSYSSATTCPCSSGYAPEEKMSSTNDECLHTANFLTWRKIQLSRAKLKASSKTSALLSGFAMVAMVELQLDEDTPKNLVIVFTVCTTLLVSVHLLALMISTCILPHIETICSSDSKSTTIVQESPHERLHWYIEIAWFFSTLLGLLLFLCEVAIICWVKFYLLSKAAAWTTSIIMIPVMIIFVAFAVHFYHTLVMHKYEVTVSGIRELELLKEQIEASDPEGRSDKTGIYGGIQII
ncbi:calcium release-activated calcium channel protein 1-like isoform X1 [Schistocerca nitens]|uniref:calcium release-activated calcium channel protein 1-like isoform X1 n=2 Tax=Schistocerca nitens TaxID=7011 RepID=UPI002118B52F|nr:calcium release-activated calcium channel protein 1-like isoform X1 [Schistocerca nitens]